MIKKVLFVFSFIVLFCSYNSISQPPVSGDKEKSPAVEGHGGERSSDSDGSQAIQNKRKSRNSSFFSFDWLFPSRARSRETSSSMAGGRQRHSAPSSDSQNAEEIGGTRFSPAQSDSEEPIRYDVRKRPQGTTNTSFIRNNASIPIQQSRREKELSIGIWDAGISIGTSHSITDVQNNKDIPFGDFLNYHSGNFNMGFGIFARYLAANWFSIRGGFNATKFEGSGKTDTQFEGYEFTNSVCEFYIKTEFHAPFMQHIPANAYVYSGLIAFFNDPTLKNNQGNVAANSDNNDYTHIQPAMPLGLGFSYNLGNNFTIGYEFGWRFTLFHYLDDYKITENHYDKYFFNFINVSYSLDWERNERNIYNN